MADPPLTIACVVDRFGSRFGGAEAYAVSLMRELDARGHVVTVFAREYDPACDLRLPFRSIPVSRHWPSWIRSWLFARRAARATRGFDIVHSHMNGWCGDVEVVHVTPVRYRWRVRTLSFARRLLARLSPRVWTYLHLERLRVAPRPARRVVAVSRLIAHQLAEAYGERLSGVPVIPPGVAPAEPVTAEERLQLRQQLDLPAAATLCLMVARNPLRKGLPTVLRALEVLPADVHLVVVGANTATRERLRRVPDAIASRVHLVAETSRVAPYYQAADLFVHPTLNDSFGMAPLEAMSFQLPVIVSPAPWCGFAEYVQPEVSALVLGGPERDDELARDIGRLRTDADLRKRLLSGAQLVLAQHSWPEVAGSFLALYRAILEERQTAQAQPRIQ